MKVSEIVQETTAGSVAAVVAPLGAVQRRKKQAVAEMQGDGRTVDNVGTELEAGDTVQIVSKQSQLHKEIVKVVDLADNTIIVQAQQGQQEKLHSSDVIKI